MIGSLLLVVSTDRAPSDAAELGFEAIESENPWARFGRHLASLRLQRGWNRQRLASLTDLPVTYLAMLEGGLREEVSAATIHRLAEALDDPANELQELVP
jgi:hypothetical protein